MTSPILSLVIFLDLLKRFFDQMTFPVEMFALKIKPSFVIKKIKLLETIGLTKVLKGNSQITWPVFEFSKIVETLVLINILFL